jgi:hypothetical protein
VPVSVSVSVSVVARLVSLESDVLVLPDVVLLDSASEKLVAVREHAVAPISATASASPRKWP